MTAPVVHAPEQNPAYVRSNQDPRGSERNPGDLHMTSINVTPRQLVHQAEWHNQAKVLSLAGPILRRNCRGALGGLEREMHFVGGHEAENLEQVAAVEPDLERIA